MLPLRVRVDQGAMTMKWVLRILQSSSITETPPIRLFSVMSWILFERRGLTPRQRSSLCILQPQPTGHSLREEVLPLCGDAIGVFNNSFWLGYLIWGVSAVVCNSECSICISIDFLIQGRIKEVANESLQTIPSLEASQHVCRSISSRCDTR